MNVLRLKLAGGGWVPTCRMNAEELLKDSTVKVEFMRFPTRQWLPLTESYEYQALMKFRVRNHEQPK